MEPTTPGGELAVRNALKGAVVGRWTLAPVPLDARMPAIEGLSLAADTREWPEASARRIVLMTSCDRPGDLARSGEPRIEARVHEPVDDDESLAAWIKRPAV